MKIAMTSIGSSCLMENCLFVDAKIRIMVSVLLTKLTNRKFEVKDSSNLRKRDANEHDERKSKGIDDQAVIIAKANSGTASRSDSKTDFGRCDISSSGEGVRGLSDKRSCRKSECFSGGANASLPNQREPFAGFLGAGLLRYAGANTGTDQVARAGQRPHYGLVSGRRELLSRSLLLDGTEPTKCWRRGRISRAPSPGTFQRKSEASGNRVDQRLCEERNKPDFGRKRRLIGLLFISWLGRSSAPEGRPSSCETTSGVLGEPAQKRARTTNLKSQLACASRTMRRLHSPFNYESVLAS